MIKLIREETEIYKDVKENEMYTIYVVFKCFEGKREAFVERVRNEGVLDGSQYQPKSNTF